MFVRDEKPPTPNEESFAPRRMPQLRVGDVVEVLSADEILATLDEKGEFENLPFMPEMLQFCGRRMTVHKVAHKLCDFIGGSGLHWLNNAVHLTGSRCTGEAHGGCQASCNLYWKEAWLRRVTPSDHAAGETETGSARPQVDASALERATRKEPFPDGSERFSCQATEVMRAAPSRIRIWHFDQYVADLRTKNVGLPTILRTVLFHAFNAYQKLSKRFLPSWLLIKEGMAWGFVKGHVPGGETPTGRLDLKLGEVVRIKSKDEIARTLNAKRLNRGMGFEEEMARACGRTARVARRVERCIDERTGKLVIVKNPCIILEGVVCGGVYHGNCPREYVPFWREIWLERVAPTSQRPREPNA
jgi:hypothetical protein